MGSIGASARRSQAPLEVSAAAQNASFQLTLAAIPAAAVTTFHHVGLAGFVTAIAMLAAICLQAATPSLTRAFRVRHVLFAGAWLLTLAGLLGAAATLLDSSAAFATVCASQTARGAGFGLATVAASLVLVANRPADQVGRALARYTLVTAWPGLVAPSIGLAILAVSSPALVNGVTAACGAIAVVALALSADPHVEAPSNRPRGFGHQSAAVWMMAASFALASGTWTGMAAYLPAALHRRAAAWPVVLLLLFGVLRYLARWRAGHWTPAAKGLTILAYTALAGAGGLAVIAAQPSILAVLVGGIVFAVGMGVFHTVVFRTMLASGGPDDRQGITAIWNGSIEVGGLVAGVGLGTVASLGGTTATLWAMTAMAGAATTIVVVAARVVPPVSLRPQLTRPPATERR